MVLVSVTVYAETINQFGYQNSGFGRTLLMGEKKLKAKGLAFHITTTIYLVSLRSEQFFETQILVTEGRGL